MRQLLGAGTLGWPRGMGWGGRWEGGSGWRTHVNPWLIHVNVWQKPLQYCKIIHLQLIKIIGGGRKQLKCPSTGEWINKMWYIDIYTIEYNSSFKEKAILTFVTNGWTYRVLCNVKIRQAEKDKYCMISFICGNPFTIYVYQIITLHTLNI